MDEDYLQKITILKENIWIVKNVGTFCLQNQENCLHFLFAAILRHKIGFLKIKKKQEKKSWGCVVPT